MKTALTILLFSVGAMAQDAQILAVVDKIPAELPGWAPWILPVILEIVLRVWPTAKPKSLLLAFSAICKALALGLEKVSSLADKIAQNVKDAPIS
jgi:hypothetical protein